MEEARFVEMHASSFGEGDALPLNLLQWFFQNLNSPVRLGPIRPGNRHVVVSRVSGEFSVIEMQKGKALEPKRAKANK